MSPIENISSQESQNSNFSTKPISILNNESIRVIEASSLVGASLNVKNVIISFEFFIEARQWMISQGYLFT